MELIWLLIAFTFLSQSSTAAYIKTKTSGSWKDLNDVCTLATPRIIYSATALTVDIDADLHLGEKDKIWVGYTKDLEVFRFHGCINQQTVTSQPTLALNTSIGLCYSACNSSNYFGVTGNSLDGAKCHCFDILNRSSLKSCNSSNDRGFAFGGRNRLAVYERVLPDMKEQLRQTDSWDVAESNCFCYCNPARTLFSWKSCSISYYFLCANRHGYQRSTMAGPWKNSSDSCFDNKSYPLSYQQNITTNETSELWLANVRSMVIISTTDRSTSIFMKYGYVERNGDKLNLKFGKQDGPYNGLCQSGKAGANKTLDDASDETRVPGTTDANKTLDGASDETEVLGTTDANQKLDGVSDETKGPVGMYVGLPFAIVLVAVAVVISLIIRRKRRASPEKVDNTRRNLTYESNNIQPNQNIIAHRPDSAEENHEIQDITESTNEGYDTIPDGYLQKSTQNNNTDVAYFVLEKHNNADYELANEVINETEHVYDTKPMNTANAITDDYDHTGNGNTALKQSLSDQPYDTTCSVKQKYKDPTYDHTGDHISNNHTGYNADYDHTGDHTTYNHTWQQKSYSHNGDNTTYDRTGDNADYDHTGDRITNGENADYDHIDDNADYDYTRSHNPYDHTGDHNSYDRIGEHAN